MDWNDGIQEFGFDCKIRKLSPRTIDNYTKQLRYFQRYLASEFDVGVLEQVKPYHIKQFLSWMDDMGRQPQYINDLLKVFKTFFNYMVREGHLSDSPAAKVRNMKLAKLKIITFSENEIRRILNFYAGRTYLEIRNQAMLAMFFDTGMRLSEVINLRWEQVREDYILVHGKGAKERLVPVSPYLAKALMKYQQVRHGYFDGRLVENYVFLSHTGRIMTPEGVTKILKKAATAVEVNPHIRVSPHTCRHTFAHIQLKNGLDLYTLSRVLGHENVAITQRYLDGIEDDEVLRKAQKTGVLANL